MKKEKRLRFVSKRRLTKKKLQQTIFADEKRFILGSEENKQNCRYWNEDSNFPERIKETYQCRISGIALRQLVGIQEAFVGM